MRTMALAIGAALAVTILVAALAGWAGGILFLIWAGAA